MGEVRVIVWPDKAVSIVGLHSDREYIEILNISPPGFKERTVAAQIVGVHEVGELKRAHLMFNDLLDAAVGDLFSEGE